MRAFTNGSAEFLRREGYFVAAPPPLPKFGEVWAPTRGGALVRLVLNVAGGTVSYLTVDHAPGTRTTIRLSTWDRWVRRYAAKVADAAP